MRRTEGDGGLGGSNADGSGAGGGGGGSGWAGGGGGGAGVTSSGGGGGASGFLGGDLLDGALGIGTNSTPDGNGLVTFTWTVGCGAPAIVLEPSFTG